MEYLEFKRSELVENHCGTTLQACLTLPADMDLKSLLHTAFATTND